MLSPRTLLAAGIAAVVTAASIAPAGAIASNAFTYAPARTGHVLIDSMALDPDGMATDSQNWFNSVGDGVGGAIGCFNSGVQLPDGAKITSLRFFAVGGAQVTLVSSDRETGATSYPVDVTKTGTAGVRFGSTVTLDTPYVVDNANKTLGLSVCLSDVANRFHAARITYTYTSAGD